MKTASDHEFSGRTKNTRKHFRFKLGRETGAVTVPRSEASSTRHTRGDFVDLAITQHESRAIPITAQAPTFENNVSPPTHTATHAFTGKKSAEAPQDTATTSTQPRDKLAHPESERFTAEIEVFVGFLKQQLTKVKRHQSRQRDYRQIVVAVLGILGDVSYRIRPHNTALVAVRERYWYDLKSTIEQQHVLFTAEFSGLSCSELRLKVMEHNLLQEKDSQIPGWVPTPLYKSTAKSTGKRSVLVNTNKPRAVDTSTEKKRPLGTSPLEQVPPPQTGTTIASGAIVTDLQSKKRARGDEDDYYAHSNSESVDTTRPMADGAREMGNTEGGWQPPRIGQGQGTDYSIRPNTERHGPQVDEASEYESTDSEADYKGVQRIYI